MLVGVITWSIGIAHLHHAVVGSVEVLAGVFAPHNARWANLLPLSDKRRGRY